MNRGLAILAALISALNGASAESRHSSPDGRWTNSLGMVFVPVPSSEASVCIWKTRVREYEAFFNSTHYESSSTGPVTWKEPGFNQGPTHPVCCVSWEDAHIFCNWLTRKDQSAGLISDVEAYRLPTDAEWSAMAGDTKYPWGDQWPPPSGAGNFAGQEVGEVEGAKFPPIEGYHDDFPRTSPVGSFPPNPHGLYDMGGNLAEWCEDQFRKEMNSDELRRDHPELDQGSKFQHVTRGSSWNVRTPFGLTQTRRGWALPETQDSQLGFRVVLAKLESVVEQKLRSYQVGVTKFEDFKADTGLVKAGDTYTIPWYSSWKLYGTGSEQKWVNSKYSSKKTFKVGDPNGLIAKVSFDAEGSLIEVHFPGQDSVPLPPDKEDDADIDQVMKALESTFLDGKLTYAMSVTYGPMLEAMGGQAGGAGGGEGTYRADEGAARGHDFVESHKTIPILFGGTVQSDRRNAQICDYPL